jgi:hypothetical protein
VLAVPLWISTAFIIAALATGVGRVSVLAAACLLPVIATILAIVYVMFITAPIASNSTAPIIVPIAFIWTMLGSVPGSFAGLSLRNLLARSK